MPLSQVRAGAGAMVLALTAQAAGAQIATVSTVDSGGVGLYSSVVYGTDGLALISYYDATNGDLKVAHCADVACTTSTKVTLDSAGDVGQYTSIAIGADGRGIISYLDATNGWLKVAHCADAACSSAAIASLATLGPAANGTAIAVPPDGRPLIAFGSGGNQLRIARCADALCTAAAAVSKASGGRNPSIAIGGDGLAVFAHDTGSEAMSIHHCRDADCIATDEVAVASSVTPAEGAFIIEYKYHPALATGPDGLISVAWLSHVTNFAFHNYYVRFARCPLPVCASFPTSLSFLTGVTSQPASDAALGIGASGRPVLAFTRFPGAYRLAAVPCSSPTCTGNLADDLGGAGEGRWPSVAVSQAGRGLVAHHDATSGSLKTAYLDGTGTSDVAPTISAFPNPVAPTGTIYYGLAVQNAGPHVARGVTVSVALPTGVTYVPAGSSPPYAPCTYDGSAHAATCQVTDVAPGSTSSGPPSIVVGGLVPPGGLPPPLVATATAATSSLDPNPANNSASVSVGTAHGIRVTAPTVREGDTGLTPAPWEFTLLPNVGPPPGTVSVQYSASSGNATPGVDFLPASGAVTLTPGAPTQTVNVSVIGDLTPEYHESVRMEMQNPQGAVLTSTVADGLIQDDDVRGEVHHGVMITADLASGPVGPFPPADTYRFQSRAPSSWEFVVDAGSGDVAPIILERLDFYSFSVIQSVQGTSGSVSLRSEFPDLIFGDYDFAIRVRSGGCSTDCDAADLYRLRAYETTGRIARFNNSTSQTTLVILQNPSSETVTAHMVLWSYYGTEESPAYTLSPHASVVVNTSSLAPDQSGSITVTHDAPYGVLQGKAVSLEPSTGFSFDTPLEYRPR